MIIGKSRNISTHLVVSSYEDIKTIYPDAYQTILDYSHIKILFETQDNNVVENFSTYIINKYPKLSINSKGHTMYIKKIDLKKSKTQALIKIQSYPTTIANWDI
jgi:type IV secretory pathway TraG/TraD family ATPase VirD4